MSELFYNTICKLLHTTLFTIGMPHLDHLMKIKV